MPAMTMSMIGVSIQKSPSVAQTNAESLGPGAQDGGGGLQKLSYFADFRSQRANGRLEKIGPPSNQIQTESKASDPPCNNVSLVLGTWRWQ